MRKFCRQILFLTLFISSFTPLSFAQGKDKALVTIGAVSGVALYNTYIAIGAVGDAYSGEVYKSDYVVELMDEQVNSLSEVQKSYNELLKSKFLEDPADIDYIKKIVKTFGYLEDEARGLKQIANGGDTDLYDKSRTKSWDSISDLLGLEN